LVPICANHLPNQPWVHLVVRHELLDAYPGEHLMVCRNPLLADERARKRGELLDATEKKLIAIRACSKAMPARMVTTLMDGGMVAVSAGSRAAPGHQRFGPGQVFLGRDQIGLVLTLFRLGQVERRLEQARGTA
jgi:hypothetical protein